MPELPEVESLKIKLAQVLTDKIFSQVKIFNDKSFHGDFHLIEKMKILSVQRKAKVIIFNLDNNFALLTHLKMTGQLIYVNDQTRFGGGHPSADWIKTLPSSHTRIEYLFDDGSHLFFNDQRKFGWMKLIKKDEIDNFFEHTAPDIIDPQITSNYLLDKFARKSQPIKQVIMDNSIVAGVGNIYACDSLNLARIAPARPAKTLSKSEVEVLTEVMKKIVTRAIELGGTTFDGKYVGIDGLAGGYQDQLRVYGQAGQPCPFCSTLIEKIKLGGRGTYFCPNCQV